MLYVLFIFHNSATVAVESSRQSGRVLALAKECLAGLGVESGWLSEHLIRKTAHFLEYSLYGVLLWNCLETYELRGKLRVVTFLWLAMLIPFVDVRCVVWYLSDGWFWVFSDQVEENGWKELWDRE